jgi:hypothetical protein
MIFQKKVQASSLKIWNKKHSIFFLSNTITVECVKLVLQLGLQFLD